MPRARPACCSATAARLTSLSTSSGTPRASARRSSSSGSCQPGRCRAYRSRSVRGSNAPGVPMTSRFSAARSRPRFEQGAVDGLADPSRRCRPQPGAASRSSNSPTIRPVMSATARQDPRRGHVERRDVGDVRHRPRTAAPSDPGDPSLLPLWRTSPAASSRASSCDAVGLDRPVSSPSPLRDSARARAAGRARRGR